MGRLGVPVIRGRKGEEHARKIPSPPEESAESSGVSRSRWEARAFYAPRETGQRLARPMQRPVSVRLRRRHDPELQRPNGDPW